MPPTRLRYYRDADGSVPVRDWLERLRRTNVAAFAKCAAKLRRLAAMGHELRRPDADLLRDGIYELRIKERRVNYRILYFFHGREMIILAHGLTKEKRVPDADIERAIRRRRLLEADPVGHIATEDRHG